MYRHGDVLLAPAKKVPGSAKRLPHLVLAQGELTGHSHRLEPSTAAELYQDGATMFLNVTATPARLVHPEHSTIELPVGLYRVWRQREYSPQAIRIIRD